MKRRHVAPRDTWPDFRVTIHLLPWTWKLRPRLYADDVEGPIGHCSFCWLFADIEWWGQKGHWIDQFTEPSAIRAEATEPGSWNTRRERLGTLWASLDEVPE